MKLIAAVLIGFCAIQTPADAASQMQPQAPDFNVTPLTKADIDTYIAVNREALERLRNAVGKERVALDWVKSINEMVSPPEEPRVNIRNPSAEDVIYEGNISRLVVLQGIDERVARERGIEDRYRAIEWAIYNRLGMSNGFYEKTPYCGRGGDCGSSPTRLQVVLMEREKTARIADKELVESHRSEFETLSNQFTDMLVPRWR